MYDVPVSRCASIRSHAAFSAGRAGETKNLVNGSGRWAETALSLTKDYESGAQLAKRHLTKNM